MSLRTAKWDTDSQFNYKYPYGSNPVFTDTEIDGVGAAAKLQLKAIANNSDNIPFTDAAKYTLSDAAKLEISTGVGKLKSAIGVNHNWPFTTPANYTISDATKLEISGGEARLFGLPYIPYLHTHLNESTGAVASDSSGNGRNGNLQNMENADWVAGKLNNCLVFDGVNEDVNFGNVADFDRTDAFSIDFWMKSSDYITTMGIIGKQTVAGLGWLIYTINTNQLRFILANAGANRIYVTAAGTANDNAWHHWVITYDGSSDASGIHIYKDNVDLALTVGQNNLSLSISNAADLTYSSRDSAQWFFDGYLDEIVIYDAELSSSDVAYRWNSGSGIERVSYAIDNPNVYPNTGQAFTAALTSFTETSTKPANTEIKYHVSSDDGVTWEYWTGAAWAVTDDSYAQANIATDINTNIGTLANSGTFRFRALLNSSTGIVTPELNNINIVSPSSYPTDDNLYIDTKDASQIAPATIFSWIAAVFTNTMPVNTDIKVLLSNDGRVKWYAWNVTAWTEPVDATLRANATSLTDAVTNFADLPLGSGTLDVRIFLYSSDSTVTPQIDNVNVTSEAGYETTGSYVSTDFYPYDYYIGLLIKNITFTAVTPSGTTLKIYAKFITGDIIDEKESDYVEYSSGDDADFDDAVFLQWKVEMTSNGENTPTLDKIEFNFYSNLALVNIVRKSVLNRLKIENNQLKYYEDDSINVFKTFNLLDKLGNPTETSPFERTLV